MHYNNRCRNVMMFVTVMNTMRAFRAFALLKPDTSYFKKCSTALHLKQLIAVNAHQLSYKKQAIITGYYF